MGYRMKGSPAKLGTIQGTTSHSSALKQSENFTKKRPWDLNIDPKLGFKKNISLLKPGGSLGVTTKGIKAEPPKPNPAKKSWRQAKVENKITKLTNKRDVDLIQKAKDKGWSDEKLLRKQQRVTDRINRREEKLGRIQAVDKYGRNRLRKEIATSMVVSLALGKPTAWSMETGLDNADIQAGKTDATKTESEKTIKKIKPFTPDKTDSYYTGSKYLGIPPIDYKLKNVGLTKKT